MSEAHAQGKRQFEISGGLSLQNFGGVQGADASYVNRPFVGVGVGYKLSRSFIAGLYYDWATPIQIDPLIFVNNSVGSYKGSMQHIQLRTGWVGRYAQVLLVAGTEFFRLTGAPNLQMKTSIKYQFGGQVSYDLYDKGKTSIPVVVRAMYNGARTYPFPAFPDDSLAIKAGIEIAAGIGVRYGF